MCACLSRTLVKVVHSDGLFTTWRRCTVCQNHEVQTRPIKGNDEEVEALIVEIEENPSVDVNGALAALRERREPEYGRWNMGAI
jgi:hypothetical protein